MVRRVADEITDLYSALFAGLQSSGYRGSICISLPVWHLPTSIMSLDSFPSILKRYGYRHISFASATKWSDAGATRMAVEYHRTEQLVGREIWLVIPDDRVR
jgi:hypothetical protein